LIVDASPLPKVALMNSDPSAHVVRVGKAAVVFARRPEPLTRVSLNLPAGSCCLILDAKPNATYRLGEEHLAASREGVIWIEKAPSGIAELRTTGER